MRTSVQTSTTRPPISHSTCGVSGLRSRCRMVISATNGRVIDASAGTSFAPMPGSPAKKIGTAANVLPSCTPQQRLPVTPHRHRAWWCGSDPGRPSRGCRRTCHAGWPMPPCHAQHRHPVGVVADEVGGLICTSACHHPLSWRTAGSVGESDCGGGVFGHVVAQPVGGRAADRQDRQHHEADADGAARQPLISEHHAEHRAARTGEDRRRGRPWPAPRARCSSATGSGRPRRSTTTPATVRRSRPQGR